MNATYCISAKKKAKLMTYLSPCDHDAAQKQEEKRSAYSWRVLLEYYDHK